MTADTARGQLDDEFHASFASRWLDAWNSHETDAVMDLLHPEIHWDDRVFWPTVLDGHDAVRTYVDRIWEVMPDVAFDEIERFVSPDRRRGLVLFRQYGSAPPSTGLTTGFDTHGCDIFLEFTDGLLSSYLSSYEIGEMMRQMGMLPEREGQVGGAYYLSLLGRGQAATV